MTKDLDICELNRTVNNLKLITESLLSSDQIMLSQFSKAYLISEGEEFQNKNSEESEEINLNKLKFPENTKVSITF